MQCTGCRLWPLTYDFSDQPTILSGSSNGTYTYDGNMKRVKAVVDGNEIYNVYDASGSLVHVDETTNGASTDYVDGPIGTLARIRNNVTTYLHPNYLGSAQSGTDSSGAVQWSEQYTPFGEELQEQAANDDQAGFTGHIRDSATGLNYMQARYYDPVIGRFLSVDRVGFTASNPMSFNRYLYVNNNPYKYNDPNGEFLNFAVKFIADVALNVAINYATTGEANLGGAITESAVGALNPASTVNKVKKVANLVGDSRQARKINCCFVAGTLVDTEHGLRPIEEIEVGDNVWSRNVETGETALKAVTDLIPKHRRKIWIVELSSQDGTLSRFETTDNHPWWISKRGWITTDQLQVGMVARTKDDLRATVIGVRETGYKDATYNITIADFETYFVGESRILVHNCKKDVPSRGSGLGGVFSHHRNSAGGRVFTSKGSINQADFEDIVQGGLQRGDNVHILSGVHGAADGTVSKATSFVHQDIAKFGNMKGVTVHDVTELSPKQLQDILEGPGTIVGAFCDSGACLR